MARSAHIQDMQMFERHFPQRYEGLWRQISVGLTRKQQRQQVVPSVFERIQRPNPPPLFVDVDESQAKELHRYLKSHKG